MIVLGNRGTQKITLGQYIVAIVGSMLNFYFFIISFEYMNSLSELNETFIKENHIKTVGDLLWVNFIHIITNPQACALGVFYCAFEIIFMLRVVATPGKDDRIIF